jgi:Xaa-Pro aminopeptidase
MRYLVGFTFPPKAIHEKDVFVPYSHFSSILVIPPEGEPSLILSHQEPNLIERAKKQIWISDLYATSFDYIDNRDRGFAEISRKILESKKKTKIGIAGTNAPYTLYQELVRAFPRTKFFDCTYDIDMLRVLKSPSELRIMREAARIADEGVRALIETSKIGVSEYAIHQAVEKAMFDAGGDNPWSVIQTGPRSEISYMSPDFTQRKLEDGDMIYADIGSELMGYHSDIQPAYIVGKGSKEKLKLIETSLDMLRAMIDATRPGATDTDVVKAAYKVSDKSPFKEYVRTWTLGHGYGVGSDYPDLTGATLTLPKSKQMTLKETMNLCLEPGLFVPGLGGAAVEDQVIVTKDGCDVLTKSGERAEELLKSQYAM